MKTRTARMIDTAFLIVFTIMALAQAFICHDYSDAVPDLLIILLFLRIIKFEKEIEEDSNGKR